MHITILTIGSRGEVQPFIALGVGLLQAGHRVQLATTNAYETVVTSHGLTFYSLGPELRDRMAARGEDGSPRQRLNALGSMRAMIQMATPMIEQLLDDMRHACDGAETIIFSFACSAAYYFAQELNVPCFWAMPYPVLNPTRAFPSIGTPHRLRLGGAYNWLTHMVLEQLAWQLARPLAKRVFRNLNWTPVPLTGIHAQIRAQRTPVLLGYSPTLLPKPPDWGDHIHVTGYWPLKPLDDWHPPVELMSFLNNGPAPFCFGFGSMTDPDPEGLTQLVLEALRRTGQRGLLVTASGALGHSDLPDDVFSIDQAPYDWLLPRMSAVVHHGGIGSTIMGLSAGIPTLIVPFWVDQYFWGARVKSLGVGPEPIPRKKLTADKLTCAIRRIISYPSMRQRAADVGARVRLENGTGNAVQIIERYRNLHSAREKSQI